MNMNKENRGIIFGLIHVVIIIIGMLLRSKGVKIKI